MSRLTCTEHKKRSLILPIGKVIHRSGGECSSKRVRIADSTFTIKEALSFIEMRAYTKNDVVESVELFTKGQHNAKRSC